MTPELLQYMQSLQGEQAAPQQEAYNPFNVGISNAVNAARDSLQMTDKQQQKAMRRALLAFGNQMSQQPVQRGFWNNVGDISRAMSPAVAAYDDADDAAFNNNSKLAQQILDYQMKDQARLDRMDEQAWRRKHLENQLAEQRRYHDMRGSKAGAGVGLTDDGKIEVEGKLYRPLDKIEMRKANSTKKLVGNGLMAVLEIEKDYQKLNDLTEGNIFQPMGGYSNAANPVKDFFGRFTGAKKLKDETAARKALEAKWGALNTVLEAAKAGGGKLGQGMYDRLKPFFPDPAHDDDETLKQKMINIGKEARIYYKAAKLASDHGVNIDPYDIYEMQENLQEVPNSPAKAVEIPTTDTGNTAVTPTNDYGFIEG